MHDLTGKVLLITGIGSQAEGWGNGTATATLFARQGATVFGCDLNVDAAQRAVERIRSDEGVRKNPVDPSSIVSVMQEPIDVTQMAACRRFVDACMQRHGRIDILINNVGGGAPGGPAEMAEEVWDKQNDLNLKTVYLMCHLVLPIMEAQTTGGAVVNLSSVAGLRYAGKPQIAYATTKAAILHFTRTTAVIYAQRTQGRVRMNAVVPGLMDTPLLTTMARNFAGGDLTALRKVREKQTPMGKMGTAWDVANAALYLSSSEAGYVTGAELVVDGGFSVSTGAEGFVPSKSRL